MNNIIENNNGNGKETAMEESLKSSESLITEYSIGNNSPNFSGKQIENIEDFKLSDYCRDDIFEKTITNIFIQKPNRNRFFRVHPQWYTPVALLKKTDTEERYVIIKNLIENLEIEIDYCILFTCMYKSGDVFQWPINHQSNNRYSTSAMAICSHAMKEWTRMVSNQTLGCYEIIKPATYFPEPIWPDKTYDEILELAFKDRMITSLDHPEIKKLQGRE